MRQGEVYWADLGEPVDSEPGYRRPVVILQNDTYNESRLRTVLVCPVTTNLRRFNFPCNVLLKVGDANLPKPCIADLTGLVAINKSDLQAALGSLPPARIRTILDGLRLLTEPV